MSESLRNSQVTNRYHVFKPLFEFLISTIFALTISQLIFLGFYWFQPYEISGHRWDNPTLLGLIPISIGVILAIVVIVVLLKKKIGGTYPLLISALALIIIESVFLAVFLVKSSNYFEPWIVQLAWFFAHNNLFLGMYIGLLFTISILIGYRYVQNFLIEDFKGRNRWIGIVIIEIGTFLTIMFKLVSKYTFYQCFLFIFIFSVICVTMIVVFYATIGDSQNQKMEMYFNTITVRSFWKRLIHYLKHNTAKVIRQLLEIVGTAMGFTTFLILTLLYPYPIGQNSYLIQLSLFFGCGGLLYLVVSRISILKKMNQT